jgi:hypothetical protein
MTYIVCLRYGAFQCVSLITGMPGMYAAPALTSAHSHASEPRHNGHPVAARLHTLRVKAHPAQTRRIGERCAATAVSTSRFCGAGRSMHRILNPLHPRNRLSRNPIFRLGHIWVTTGPVVHP